MKKRILALALAGTTAFSVFGAAMSASAASSHVVYGNDPYTTYQPATVTYGAVGGYVNTITGKVVEKNDLVTTNPQVGDIQYTDKLDAAVKNFDTVLAALGYNRDTGTGKIYKHTVLPFVGAEIELVDTYYWSTVPTGLSDTDVVLDGDKTGENIGDVYSGATSVFTKTNDTVYGKVYPNTTVAIEMQAYAEKAYADEIQANYTANPSSAVVVNPKYAYKYTYAYGEGALVADELSRDGVTVENGNVYAYDYFTTGADVAYFEEVWNAANFVKTANYTTLTSRGDATKLINVLTQIEGVSADGTLDKNDALVGPGGYYSARRAVVEEYEDFLVEIGLMDYAANGQIRATNISKTDFLSMYSYEYNKNDEYNFIGLVNDLYISVTNYNQTTSSNLVYLMQQYDKYVDGSYIGEKEIGESRWAELLIDCLNAVDEGNFTTSSAYKTYKRAADSAINDYEDASTTAQQKSAIQGLYNAVTTNVYGKSSGVDKAELVESLNSLYFNNKSIPAVYMETYKRDSNIADLTLYTYGGITLAANNLDSTVKVTSVKTVYPLYPAADYYQKDREGAEYAGIAAGTVADNVTEDYEWFANVYQLATAVNAQSKNGSYQGIVDTVNSALNEAVSELAVTTTPSGSASLRLEEAVDAYAGKIESDYAVKYYNAYDKANDYAAAVEGKYQTLYAIEMVESSGQALSYQGTQTTVTKGMINDLKASIKDGQSALDALKKDKDNYNAAQVLALTKAIDAAQDIVDDYNGTTSTKVNGVKTASAGDKDNFVISDLTKATQAINDAINFKNVLQGWSKNEAGKWMYGVDDAYLNNGWNKIGSVWYYFNEDGTAKQSEWMQENGKWYWFNSNAGAAIGWAKVDNQWYYFGGNNAMKTGWQKVDGSWYYLASSGRMITGWAQVDGKWYYMSKESNSLGQMLANTTTPDGYKVGADGAMIEK